MDIRRTALAPSQKNIALVDRWTDRGTKASFSTQIPRGDTQREKNWQTYRELLRLTISRVVDHERKDRLDARACAVGAEDVLRVKLDPRAISLRQELADRFSDRKQSLRPPPQPSTHAA